MSGDTVLEFLENSEPLPSERLVNMSCLYFHDRVHNQNFVKTGCHERQPLLIPYSPYFKLEFIFGWFPKSWSLLCTELFMSTYFAFKQNLHLCSVSNLRIFLVFQLRTFKVGFSGPKSFRDVWEMYAWCRWCVVTKLDAAFLLTAVFFFFTQYALLSISIPFWDFFCLSAIIETCPVWIRDFPIRVCVPASYYEFLYKNSSRPEFIARRVSHHQQVTRFRRESRL